ncbi:uncharacterized protein N7484_011979 [Penicillium longicatenatum]|uniref:uncharacterized protein n=1 Tax=Penicillium longicatenatum TaxID=1561947 RepID=UPI00254839CE|nr:uncharacterized protein N7484_011979 [Penicillium longicatenatum]KAJ5631879.1 hypothetical protein N7484_011979 [Penicillium longicatenatum]
MREFGEEVALQAKSKSVQVVLGPNINLHRDPRAGRNFESFSEDPLVTARMAAAIVNGIQSQGVGACVKHFIANESETVRRRYNVDESGDSRTMREIYLRTFQYLLQQSNPVSIMTAYNALDGNFCSQTPLIRSLLRETWGYDGCMMSDWYGTKTTIAALEAGLDLEMPGTSVFRGTKLVEAINCKEVPVQALDLAVSNVLGMIDKTSVSHSDKEEGSRVCEKTSAIALRTAAEGIVLLKNRDNCLPLNMADHPQVALIGAAAAIPSMTGGGSACAKPQYTHTPLQCFQNACKDPKQVSFAHGVNPNYAVPLMSPNITQAREGLPGVDVDYFMDGCETPVYSEYIAQPVVVMLGRLKPGLTKQTGFHYIMETTVTANKSGSHTLAVQATGEFTLFVDGKEVLSKPAPEMSVEDFLFQPKKLESIIQIQMNAHQPYKITLRTHSRDISSGEGEVSPHSAKLCFEEAYDDRAAIAEAVSIAAQSDVSIIMGGRTREHESEGFDLTTLKLPDSQVRMIKAVASVSKKTILVLHGGNPIDVSDFVEDIDVVIAAHFPGQEGAQAIVDIITGKTNPSGKLATTWPMSLSESSVPSFAHFPAKDVGNGPVIRYSEGLQMGYRNSLTASSARWLFGHGLSYSSFEYDNLKVIRQDRVDGESSGECRIKMITISVDVQNTSQRAGYEVIQVYSEPPVDRVIWKPRSELIGFAKQWFEPGETKQVKLAIPQRDVSGYWDRAAKVWRSLIGMYKVTTGAGAGVAYLQIEDTAIWNEL